MEISRRALSLGVIAILAVGTVVLADPPTVSIQQQAELIPGLGIVVRVVVDCGADQTDGTIEVGVRQGETIGENIDSVVMAEGRQEIEVFIFGPTFVPGEASASASLVCGLLVQGLDLGATIKISE
jgi:hypothetical protein